MSSLFIDYKDFVLIRQVNNLYLQLTLVVNIKFVYPKCVYNLVPDYFKPKSDFESRVNNKLI